MGIIAIVSALMGWRTEYREESPAWFLYLDMSESFSGDMVLFTHPVTTFIPVLLAAYDG